MHVTAPDGLEQKEALRERWLQEMFEQAARDESGCMDEKTAISLIQKLSCSGEDTTGRIKQKLAVRNVGLTHRHSAEMFLLVWSANERFYIIFGIDNIN